MSSDNLDQRRDDVDRCPGALSTHRAADGELARVRLPGGALTSQQMGVLATAAAELSDGAMELTSRGNVQFRAVSDRDELAERLAGAGLLPSPTHERVRNILASPLTGRMGGLADVRPLVTEFDARLRATPALAELPGRTLFAFDDGRGDVASQAPDFGVQALSPDDAALILAGRDSGVRMPLAGVVTTLLDVAQAFLDARESEWRLREVHDGVARVVQATGLPVGPTADLTTAESPMPPIGWLPQRDGRVALGGALALGRLDARLAEFLAAVDTPIVVTPWRSIVLCDLDEGVADTVVRVLAPMGLIFDENSPWIEASACTGSPGCDKSHADVRADLRSAVEAGGVEGRQHWSGCERRCGKPTGEFLDIVAGPDGYRMP